ncbi:MAG: PH domain-containing protein [Candidatus Bathyarchaeota archaeon]
MSKLDDYLEPFEKVIWKGKPDKKAFMAWVLGGIPFALVFLFGAFLFHNFGVPLESPLILFIIFACGLIIIPTPLQLRKYTNTEYMITNQRLFIKQGLVKDDLWVVRLYRLFANQGTHIDDPWVVNLSKIKEVIIKKGICDKIFGTGSIYPITAEYPYAPKLRSYTSSEYETAPWNKLKKVYNVAEGKNEEITEIELYTKTMIHPHLKNLKKAHSVEKLLRATIKENEPNS